MSASTGPSIALEASFPALDPAGRNPSSQWDMSPDHRVKQREHLNQRDMSLYPLERRTAPALAPRRFLRTQLLPDAAEAGCLWFRRARGTAQLTTEAVKRQPR
jgi:hypothetical protein